MGKSRSEIAFPKPVRKRKADKVQKIKLQERRECWVCGTTQYLEEHHAFGGPNRKLSERYGLKAYFCHNHHNENIPGDPGIHFNSGLMLRFKQYAQLKFEAVYSPDKFIELFGKNYL